MTLLAGGFEGEGLDSGELWLAVWEDIGPDGAGTVGAVGGVSGAKARVFMIQVSFFIATTRGLC